MPNELRLLTSFVTRAVNDFDTVASVVPSSPFLSRAMVEDIDWTLVRSAAELGPGAGPMTKAILRRLRPDAALYAVELDPHLHRQLDASFSDPRLHAILGNARDLGALLRQRRGPARVDAIVSSLGLSLMPLDVRTSIVRAAVESLEDGGVFTQFSYFHTRRLLPRRARSLRFTRFDALPFLEQFFGRVDVRLVMANFPPAFVYVCREPRRGSHPRPHAVG